MSNYTLYGRRGWGSALVEVELDYCGLAHDFKEVPDLFKSAEGREALAKLNPVAQVPTLVLPDGRVMTESAAIALHLAEISGLEGLAPPPGHRARPVFLRWLVFLVANVYPTFTYADDPGRFVPDAMVAKAFRANVDAYAERLWRMVEAQADAPWFLGERFSALDIFIAVMTHWRPRRPWFQANTPRLFTIATACDAHPKLAAALARNFPKAAGG